VLALFGEQGCAKSTTARAVRRMIDPNEADLRAAPTDTRDLMIAANNGWVIGFDNLSALRPGLSDDLASLATGAGFATRTLYADDEETIFASARPVVVNGIEDVITRPDLLDRALVIRPPLISDDARVDEETFWSDFDRARPAILGAVCTAVQTALGRVSSTVLPTAPRMADFARWVVAAETALDMPADTSFIDVYAANRKQAQGLALEDSAVASAILELVTARGEWSGKAVDLAARILPDPTPRDWPTTGQAMAGALKRSAPLLRGNGVEVSYDERARPRTWTLTRTQGGER
jgi:hypothetical protein